MGKVREPVRVIWESKRTHAAKETRVKTKYSTAKRSSDWNVRPYPTTKIGAISQPSLDFVREPTGTEVLRVARSKSNYEGY